MSKLKSRRRALLAGAVVLLIAGYGWYRAKQRSLPPGAEQAPGGELEVGYLPVTCHLTCPITDFASRTSAHFRFKSRRFFDFPTVVEAFKANSLQASFMIAPLAMKLREQGVKVKIVYLGHRDGSTIIVHKDGAVHSLRDLAGKRFAIPSRYSNQFLVLNKLLEREGVDGGSIKFFELPPPDMPAALAAHSIDGYFVGEPFAAKAEVAGFGRVLYHAKDIWPRFISCVLVVREDLIAQHRELVADLVRGIAQSGAWAEGHREEAAKLAAPYYHQDEALLRYVLTTPRNRVSYNMLIPTPAELADIYAMGVKSHILQGGTPMTDLLDLSLIPDGPTLPSATLPL